MRIIRDVKHCPEDARGAVIALGNFDGVHAGHRAIIRYAIDTARAKGVPSAVMTFEPHPREFFAKRAGEETGKTKQSLRIYSLRQKLALLAECGVDVVYLMRFGPQLAATSAHDFIETLLHRQLQAAHLVTGFNFAFGRGRQGNTDMLASYARQAGFGFTAHDAVLLNGQPISSTAIRELLAAGDITAASRLLGHGYHLCGRVQGGAARGRTLGFPTINLPLKGLYKPKLGVYAVRVRIEGEAPQGTARWHDGVANIGIKPTFDDKEPLLEVHIFDFDRMVYGQRAEVRFFAFLRPEQRFASVDELVTQIHKDTAQAKTALQQQPAFSPPTPHDTPSKAP